LQAIQEEWDELPLYAQLGQPEGGEAQPSERALEDLAQLTQQVTNEQLRASLQQAQADLENANTRANEARDRAIKALIRMGAYLNNKLFDNNRRLRSIDIARQTALDNFAKLQEQVRGRADEQQQIERARASIEQIDQALTGQQQALAIVLSYYGDIVIEAAGDYAMALIEPQLSILEQEFEQQQSAYLIVHAGLFVRHLNEYQTTQQADTQRWLQEVLSL
jgi:hypothetical protein